VLDDPSADARGEAMVNIQFGIFPITEDWPNGADMARVYNEIVAEAKMAESVGFDSCLITEHHQQADGYFPNPLMVSAGVARETTTLKVGSCVALAPLYNPIRLTEDAALLDVISGGRLILGLGASYVSEDLAAFGVDVTQRGPLMEDTVRFLTEAWTKDNLDFDGEVFHFQNMRVTPKPVQQPRPPVWLGAWTPQGLRRAGRLGDAWVTDVINTLGTFKMSHFMIGPTELRILLAIGSLVLLVHPMASLFGREYRLFDVGGAVGICGMVATLARAVTTNTRALYRAEPLPGLCPSRRVSR